MNPECKECKERKIQDVIESLTCTCALVFTILVFTCVYFAGKYGSFDNYQYLYFELDWDRALNSILPNFIFFTVWAFIFGGLDESLKKICIYYPEKKKVFIDPVINYLNDRAIYPKEQ